MSLVQHQLRHPDTGQPLKNKSVKVQLASDGFDGHVEIIQTSFPTTDDTGHLSIDLTPNAQVTPANTHYVMTLTKGPTWTFIVPATTQPTGGFWLNDILVTSPPDPDEMFFGLPTPFGPDGQVVKMVAGVPAWDDEAGGGGGAPTGPAGGVLGGTYPDPSFAVDMATQAELDAAAAAAATDATTKANAAQSAATTAAATDATSKANAAQAAATAAAATDATTKANAAQAASQPLDPDLTTIAALDASTPGVLSTDGGGWIRKTYAQIKTALGLVKADVGLGNVDNTSDANKPVSTAQQTAIDLKLAKASNLSDLGNAGTARSNLGLGTLATQSGTFSGTSSGTNTGDQTITLTGDVTGSGAGSFAATLATSGVTAAAYGDATHVAQVTFDAKGRATLAASVAIAIPESAVTNLTTDLAAKAPLASPALTGTPTAPTATPATNSTQIATTAYADAKVENAVTAGHTAVAPSGDAVNTALALKAPLASPTFTGTPAAPTPSQADNSTKLATTAYVDTATAAALTAARAAVGVAIVLGA